VRWAGRTAGPAERASCFGYLPEQRGLYARMRVGEQLVYLARLHGLDAAEARTSVARWVDRLGLAERVSDRVQDLSHGNQQRVQLAAALVHEPAVLLLDEPFTGLDPVGVAVLSEVLRERAAAGVVILFSSHQLDLVESLCDAVWIVDGGRIVASGTMDELVASRPRRLVVEVDGTGAEWAAALAAVTVLEASGARVRLLLEDGADPQDVLAAATHAGALLHFGFERASLSEIFLDAVAGAPRATKAIAA
jgi:ABC-2 type transport system ATP-binding protein